MAPFFSECIDSFYARDIQELFGIRNRQGFLSLFRLLLRQSGGQLDYSQPANLSGLSRPAVKAHIEVMQISHAVFLLRPFHGAGGDVQRMNQISGIAASGCFFKKLANIIIAHQIFCNIK
jgi:predicted AAA+ superfamily ATPase